MARNVSHRFEHLVPTSRHCFGKLEPSRQKAWQRWVTKNGFWGVTAEAHQLLVPCSAFWSTETCSSEANAKHASLHALPAVGRPLKLQSSMHCSSLKLHLLGTCHSNRKNRQDGVRASIAHRTAWHHIVPESTSGTLYHTHTMLRLPQKTRPEFILPPSRRARLRLSL